MYSFKSYLATENTAPVTAPIEFTRIKNEIVKTKIGMGLKKCHACFKAINYQLDGSCAHFIYSVHMYCF